MKKAILSFFLISSAATLLRAQPVLNVGQIAQEQTEWCWAGVSKCVMDYYGSNYQQCDIAEFARLNITWHNFGTTDCCADPSQGCNYWNFNWGANGSIEDILNTLGSITVTNITGDITETAFDTEIANNNLMILRWGWTSGGGHFIVGHGTSTGNMYYMNPWPGEGLKIAAYSWVQSNPASTWTHTQKVSSFPTGITQINTTTLNISPNPSDGMFWLSGLKKGARYDLQLCNTLGEKIYSESILNYNGEKKSISAPTLSAGIYFLKVVSEDGSFFQNKIIIEK